MKKGFSLAFSLALILSGCTRMRNTQNLFEIRTDTLKVYNPNGSSAELELQNSTRKVVNGVLTNIDTNGLTQFKKLQLVNVGDTGIGIVGQDTLTIPSLPKGGGLMNGPLHIYTNGVGQKITLGMHNTGNRPDAPMDLFNG